MLRLVLVRHGKTLGNTQGRYIGTTDEPLCQEGRELLFSGVKKGIYPAVGLVFSSPLGRCLETAEILYPGQEPIVIEGFRECGFGAFENKNFQDLSGNQDYQAWIDSNGTLPFPGGESREEVGRRVADAFHKMLGICREKGLCKTWELCQGKEISKPRDIYQGKNFPETPIGRQWEGSRREEPAAALIAHGGTIMSLMERFGSPRRDYFDWQVKNGCGFLAEVKVEYGTVTIGVNAGISP